MRSSERKDRRTRNLPESQAWPRRVQVDEVVLACEGEGPKEEKEKSLSPSEEGSERVMTVEP